MFNKKGIKLLALLVQAKCPIALQMICNNRFEGILKELDVFFQMLFS